MPRAPPHHAPLGTYLFTLDTPTFQYKFRSAGPWSTINISEVVFFQQGVTLKEFNGDATYSVVYDRFQLSALTYGSFTDSYAVKQLQVEFTVGSKPIYHYSNAAALSTPLAATFKRFQFVQITIDSSGELIDQTLAVLSRIPGTTHVELADEAPAAATAAHALASMPSTPAPVPAQTAAAPISPPPLVPAQAAPIPSSPPAAPGTGTSPMTTHLTALRTQLAATQASCILYCATLRADGDAAIPEKEREMAAAVDRDVEKGVREAEVECEYKLARLTDEIEMVEMRGWV